MIKRNLKERLIEDLKNGRKIIILYGSRQVGKTTLINEVIKQLDFKSLFINADSGENLDILSSRNKSLLSR